MSFIASYRRVLSVPGAAAFSLAGLVARMALPMTSLGIVLFLQATSGEYAVGGAVSAVGTIAGAFVTVLQGRLIDRVGQSRVLPFCACVYGASMVLLVISQLGGWGIGFAYAFAALAGASAPSVGSAVRARWSHLLDDPRALNTAFALESVNDEIVFLLGPLICTFLATSWHSWSGVICAAVLSVVGTAFFVAQRGTEPPPRPRSAEDARPPLPWRVMVPLMLGCFALGVLFGSCEVTTVAFSAEHGHRGLAGIPLALWAFGSMIAGLVTGAMHHRSSLATRIQVAALFLTATTVPLLFVGTLPLLCLVLTLASIAISPTIVATLSLAEQILPAGRLTEGMALLFTGMIAGEAPASALSGWLVDRHGASTAYAVMVGAAALAAVVAFLLPRRPAHPIATDLGVDATGAPA